MTRSSCSPPYYLLAMLLLFSSCSTLKPKTAPPRFSAPLSIDQTATEQPTRQWRRLEIPPDLAFSQVLEIAARTGLSLLHRDDDIGLLEARTPAGNPFTAVLAPQDSGLVLTVSSMEPAALAAFLSLWDKQTEERTDR